MKIVGLLFLLAGFILLGVVTYVYFSGNANEVSPIPETNGVRVIFITPTGTK